LRYEVRLRDWQPTNGVGSLGRWLARLSPQLGMAGAVVGSGWYVFTNQGRNLDILPSPEFLVVGILWISPGLIAGVIGLLLLARNATYISAGSVPWRWWNWLMWRY
jgi:hypothetical protein